MTDKIVNPGQHEWSRNKRKPGSKKYGHLMDGKCRELDNKDYGIIDMENFRAALGVTARRMGLVYRSSIINDGNKLLFQVIGERY